MKRQLAIWGAVLAVLGTMPTARCAKAEEGATVLPPPPERPNARQRRYGTKLQMHGTPDVPAPVAPQKPVPEGLEEGLREGPSVGLTRPPGSPAGTPPPPEAPRRSAPEDKASTKSWLMMSVDEILAGPGATNAHQTISWGWLADSLRTAEDDDEADEEEGPKPDSEDPWGQKKKDDLPASVFNRPYDAQYDATSGMAPGLASRASTPGVSGMDRAVEQKDSFAKPFLLKDTDRMSRVTRDIFQREPETVAPAEPEKTSEGLAAHSAPRDTFPAPGGEAASLPALSGQPPPSLLTNPAGVGSSPAMPSGSMGDSSRSAWGLPSLGGQAGTSAGMTASSLSALPGASGSDRRGPGPSVGGNSGFSSGTGAMGRPLFSSSGGFGGRIDSTFTKPFESARPPAPAPSTEASSRNNLIKTAFPEAKSPLGW